MHCLDALYLRSLACFVYSSRFQSCSWLAIVFNRFNTMKSNKYTIAFVLLSISIVQCAFPLERDVNDVTGISQEKLWFVFTKRFVRTCFQALKNTNSSIIDELRCLTKSESEKCLPNKNSCLLIKKEPNTLIYGIDISSMRNTVSISIKVHVMFFVNVTVIFFNTEDALGNANRYMEINLFKTSYRYHKRSHPWSVYGHSNTIKISFYKMLIGSVMLEYTIQQKYHSIGNHVSGTVSLIYSWGHFLVKSLQIIVDVQYRVEAYIWTCSSCHALIYDGPSAMLPMIFETSTSFRGPDFVLASTFQVFMVLIEGHHNNTNVLIRYNATYQPQIVTNLQQHEAYVVTFHNKTNCKSHTSISRACVFEISGSNIRNVDLSIQKINFQGLYSGAEFGAGLLVLNEIGGKTETVFKLYDKVFPPVETEMNLTITGRKIFILIYAYSVFATATIRVAVSNTDCLCVFLDNSKALFSQLVYLSNHTGNKDVASIGISLSSPNTCRMDLSTFLKPGYRRCIQFHIAQLHQTVITQKRYFFIFKPTILVAVQIKQWMLHSVSVGLWCRPKMFGHLYNLEQKYGQNFFAERSLGILFDVYITYCSKYMFYSISLESVRCRIPCSTIGFALQHGLENKHKMCDICDNVYLNKYHHNSGALRYSAMLPIRIWPNICPILRLEIKGLSYFQFSFKINATFRIPELSGGSVKLNPGAGCEVAFPMVALKTDFDFGIPKEISFKPLIVWDNYWYNMFFRDNAISWEDAALHCTAMSGNLLTIQNLDEYSFIEEKFLSVFDMVLIYVGMRMKVNAWRHL